MKKITSLLAIAAVALTATLSFGSCSKNDDPAVEPEDKVLPIDSLVSFVEYDYSEDFLKLYDIQYVVKDFSGKSETFTVTEPGLTIKSYKTTNISETGRVTVTTTRKDVKNPFTTDSVHLKSIMSLTDAAYVKGKPIYARDIPHPWNIDEVVDTESAINNSLAKEFSYGFYVQEDFANGVTESWFNQHCK